MPELNDAYSNGRVSLDAEVQRPLYENAINLMRGSKGRAGLFDFWARGNYTRRLLYLRQHNVHPLLVRVSNADEMRWAHRRLSLVGAPIDFVYVGPLAGPTKCVHVLSLPHDHMWDAGWGYIATQWKAKGKYAAMLIGTARLMPEQVLDWLTIEAEGDFREGNIFVAPSELIGIDPGASDALAPVAAIAGGATLEPQFAPAIAALELDIPFLDKLSPRAYKRFVRDHESDLIRFRHAFGRLVTESARDQEQLRDWIAEVRAEVADMTLSDKFSRLRREIVSAGGVLGVLTACAGAFVAASTPILAVGAGAAGAALIDLWKQSLERRAARSSSRLSLLWNLGIQRGSLVRRARRVHVAPVPPQQRGDAQPPISHHWLCPPTNGVLFAGVKK